MRDLPLIADRLITNRHNKRIFKVKCLIFLYFTKVSVQELYLY